MSSPSPGRRKRACRRVRNRAWRSPLSVTWYLEQVRAWFGRPLWEMRPAVGELLIAQSWLHRDDFTSRFVTVHPGTGSSQLMTVIDWPAAVAALGSNLACSGGEQRMLKITASLADGISVDLQDTLTGLDDDNIARLVNAILHADGKRPGTSGYGQNVRVLRRDRLGGLIHEYAQVA